MNQTLLSFIKKRFAFIPLAMCLMASAYAKKPLNVLFIAVDDLKPSIGAFGDSMAITPNLDRLSQSSTIFLNNHCQKAICGPSRASLMMGLRPDTAKVWVFGERMREINPDTLTIPQHFKNLGYETTAVGKIYDPRNVNGKFDPESWSIPHKSYGDFMFHPDYPTPTNGAFHNEKSKAAFAAAKASGLEGYTAIDKYLRANEGRPSVECLDLPDNAYTDGAIALRAIEMMKELAQGDKPFFLGVGFAKPHLPFIAPKKYWDLYDREDISMHPFQKRSSNPVKFAYHGSGELKGYSDIPNNMNSYSDDPKRWLSEEKQRELIHGYYACTSYVDAQVGKLMEALVANGLVNNTIIVFWGDHGFHLGDHGLWHKHTNFEQATRSPLLIRLPGMGKSVTTAPTEFIDIFPTLCELAELPLPDHLEGKSLVPLMRDANASVKPFAVSQYSYAGKMGYSIRTERFRYTEWLEDWRTFQPYDPAKVKGRELYDYKKDPGETMNLVDDPEYKSALQEMKKMLLAFFEENLKNA